jgi:hypothetical protein
LFNDGGTSIVAKNYKILKEDIDFDVKSDYNKLVNHGHHNQKKAFYFELDIINRNYTETQKILYFEAENIDF